MHHRDVTWLFMNATVVWVSIVLVPVLSIWCWLFPYPSCGSGKSITAWTWNSQERMHCKFVIMRILNKNLRFFLNGSRCIVYHIIIYLYILSFIEAFFYSFGWYFCSLCVTSFSQSQNRHPPDTGSGAACSTWKMNCRGNEATSRTECWENP